MEDGEEDDEADGGLEHGGTRLRVNSCPVAQHVAEPGSVREVPFVSALFPLKDKKH